MKRVHTCALALCLAVSTVTPSLAAGMRGNPPHRVVTLADLNLSSRAGAGEALLRLRVAAESVCGGGAYMMDLQTQIWFRHCVDGAMGRAVVSLHAPLVAALYNGEPVQTAGGEREHLAARN